MHLCGVCSVDSSRHPSSCYEEDCEVIKHWPVLCCPGCLCLSYEEAHGLVMEEAA